MNFFLFIMIVIWSLFIHGMENIQPNQLIIKMPSRDKLENMFQEISLLPLAQYYDAKKVEAFYTLAGQDVEVNKLKSTIEKFYADFQSLRLANNIPRKLQFQNMNEVIAMEYAYFAKKLFEPTPNYWKTIESEFEKIVHNAGYKKFKFLNMNTNDFTRKNKY